MSVASEISRIKSNIANAYSKIDEKGGKLPEIQNSENLTNSIDSITGGGTGGKYYTGDYDRQGLKAIGYTDEDVDWYNNFTYWFQSENNNHLLTQYDKDLYNVVTENNISLYKNKIRYLPFININKLLANLNNKFSNMYFLETIPKLDTSNGTTFSNMFNNCSSLETIPKLDTSKAISLGSMFYGCSSLKTIPELDTSKCTNLGSMFYGCSSLKTIPELDTSKCTNLGSMFHGCSSLKTIPELDTSNGTTFSNMFNNCFSLFTIPELDTSNGTSFDSMFNNCFSLQAIYLSDTINGTSFNSFCSSCYSLKEILGLNTSNSTSFRSMFNNCSSLETIPKLDTSKCTNLTSAFYNCSSLYNCGGFLNLGESYETIKAANYNNYTLSVSASTKLTYESLMNIINKLYDIKSKGVKTQILQLGSTNMAKLTPEEIAIATEKGWTVS